MTALDAAIAQVDWSDRERQAWEPKPLPSVAAWARENFFITTEMGASIPGYYDPEMTPWVYEVFEEFLNPQIEELVLVWPAQVGKSLVEQVCIGYIIDNDPANIAYFMDTDENARFTSEHRIQAFIDGNPHLARKVQPKHKRNKLKIAFDGGVFFMAGANSASQLSNKSARYVFMDETGKWKAALGAEAGAYSLARERASGQLLFKIIDASTPVVEGDQILTQQALSDQRTLHVPCPHCGRYQTLEWESVRWPKKEDGHSVTPAAARLGAWYECLGGCRIEHSSKVWMLRHCRWQKKGLEIVDGKEWTVEMPDGTVRGYAFAGFAEPNSVAGFHLNRLYSPFRTWGQLAEEYLKIGNDRSAKQNFVNSALALPWRQNVHRVKEEELSENINRDLPPGVVPDGYTMLTAGADVQQDSVYYTVYAWRLPDGARHLVEHGQVNIPADLGQVTDGAHWQDRIQRSYSLAMMFCDCRYRRTEVDAFIRGRANAFACQGVTQSTRGPVYVATDNKTGDRRKLPRHLWMQRASVYGDAFKDEISDRIGIVWDRQEMPDLPPAGYVSFHADTDAGFLHHFTAEERKQTTDIRGRTRFEWVIKRPANHYFDATVYAAAAFYYYKPLAARSRRNRRPMPASGNHRGGGFLGDARVW